MSVYERIRAEHEAGCMVCDWTDERCSLGIMVDEHEIVRTLAIEYAFMECEFVASGQFDGPCISDGHLDVPEYCGPCKARHILREH